MFLVNNLWNQLKFLGIFLAGFSAGGVTFSLIYLFFIVKNFNKDFKISFNKEEDLAENEKVNKLIKKHQLMFLDKTQENPQKYIEILFQEIKKLTLEIATIFYPKSTSPCLELNLGETLLLIEYLHKRIDILFQNKILCIFKRMTLRQIMVLKFKLINKKYLKKIQKTNKVMNFLSTSVNLINPFYWARKLFLQRLYHVLLDKIGLAIILISGEEIYKVYSKKIFVPDQDLKLYLHNLKQELDKNDKNNK
ncbi:hypothetical protein OC707_01570 ['Opuntia sp.' phytoplasma]|uniref:Transmembrane protein n=1 Tax=Candidatus Phytoplasma asiaticum TaxID=2763338 RepID=A0AAX3B9T8_9MOLU|nr:MULTISPECIES: hypothetical protein [Phytoplasma]MDO8054137.1 hypothetical protein ['Opuntia sp.' phytoplasma]MDO8057979.1 hypothetical protein ['Opuntia sp.' phytoplasma]UQV27431.1 hypothetical protein H7686_0001260 ['Parthenium hysterophorus' phyllody phytoplasma]